MLRKHNEERYAASHQGAKVVKLISDRVKSNDSRHAGARARDARGFLRIRCRHGEKGKRIS